MKTGNIISAITASLLLIACGGDNATTDTTTPTATDTSTPSSPKISTGYYVDAAVAGVEFNCTTQTGTTDENGTFTFGDNDTCTFSIGGVVLREVNASLLEDNVTILENNLTVAQFLQTLDSDGNASNGIEILPEAHDVLKERNSTHVPQNNAELLDIKDALQEKVPERYHGDIVSEQDAIEHLEETRAELREDNRRTQDDVKKDKNNSHNNEENYLNDFDTNQTIPIDQNSTRAENFNEEEHNNENNGTKLNNDHQANRGEGRPNR